ncbi:FtsB family cell division protein [Dethiobacter alkaliphilus]|uniref:Septum formation initiator n=1 Tax=Dethiobacter alkaliphilus AHT 1 TaxID=555088 RepID=C0GIZ9_DETAL|nr:septum formation initiator family protein [Dethiobacter alkaliphilus]EEG76632.1 Septum formation initiator [Dethiobacter alkaliphilus AHT 1]
MRAVTAAKSKNLAYLPGARGGRPWQKRLIMGLILVVVLYFGLLFAAQYWRLVQFRQTLDEIDAQIAGARAQNEEMQAEIERLHSPAYLEEMARQELGMVRSGELLFFFQKPDNLPQ